MVPMSRENNPKRQSKYFKQLDPRIELRIYKSPLLFWNEVSPHLKKNEAINSLCLAISYQFQSRPENCLFQCALFKGNEFIGALVCSRHNTSTNIVPTPISQPKYIKILFQELLISRILVTGIVGETHTAREYEKLFNQSSINTRTYSIQGIYRCQHVLVPIDADYTEFRMAKLEDVPTISKWIENFHYEAIPYDPPVNGKKLAEMKIKDKMIYVLVKANELVSMAAWSRELETSCSVNLVYTPAQNRNKGYASTLTAKLTQFLLNSGKEEVHLYTDMNNPTSNKIYQDIGYQFVCDSIHIGIFP
jgi:predicted GNAT family acetyltransferase